MSRGRRVEKSGESKAPISEEILRDRGKEIVRSARRGGKGGSYATDAFKQSECGARISNDKDVSDCS
ncbi:MAG: hypothetical protein J7L30_02025 [Methanophagales archaeon]|nr:hypothetical protein [Methanophagales archaeon]